MTAESRGVNPWGAEVGEGVVDELCTRSGAALLLAHNLLLNCPDCAGGGERVLRVYLKLPPRTRIGEDIPHTKASLLETLINSACNTSISMRIDVWRVVEANSTHISADFTIYGTGTHNPPIITTPYCMNTLYPIPYNL
mmetsp:Transcript_2317/g.5142  ORF Transcript_2317/g.5142 Transcript_2317/m.5142 type:complete len:139 (-) Transcript_2317:22-438(-)